VNLHPSRIFPFGFGIRFGERLVEIDAHAGNLVSTGLDKLSVNRFAGMRLPSLYVLVSHIGPSLKQSDCKSLHDSFLEQPSLLRGVDWYHSRGCYPNLNFTHRK
jgi:hypothetical protein